MPDRLSETFRGILHPRVEPREPAVPGGTAAHTLVIDRAHDRGGHGDHGRGRQQEHEWPVRHLPVRERREQPPRRRRSAERVSEQLTGHLLERGNDLRRKQPERYAAGREPQHPHPLQPAAVVRLAERGLAGLTEEYDAEELDHDVTRERCTERDRGGAQRQQHVHER